LNYFRIFLTRVLYKFIFLRLFPFPSQ